MDSNSNSIALNKFIEQSSWILRYGKPYLQFFNPNKMYVKYEFYDGWIILRIQWDFSEDFPPKPNYNNKSKDIIPKPSAVKNRWKQEFLITINTSFDVVNFEYWYQGHLRDYGLTYHPEDRTGDDNGYGHANIKLRHKVQFKMTNENEF